MSPIKVFPPLKGEWLAATTPGDRIPSHGTHEWAMTYAFDFIRVVKDQKGNASWHRKTTIEYLLAQVKLEDTYGWGEPVFAPINGVVREVVNGIKERQRLHLLTDVALALTHSVFFSYKRGEIHRLSGNYVIIEGDNCCALIAHAKTGSIKLKVGDSVTAGDLIAEVGHSGNSTAPHLHFQLMDGTNIKTAKGLPCCFINYDVLYDESWVPIDNGIPTSKNLIRFNA